MIESQVHLNIHGNLKCTHSVHGKIPQAVRWIKPYLIILDRPESNIQSRSGDVGKCIELLNSVLCTEFIVTYLHPLQKIYDDIDGMMEPDEWYLHRQSVIEMVLNFNGPVLAAWGKDLMTQKFVKNYGDNFRQIQCFDKYENGVPVSIKESAVKSSFPNLFSCEVSLK